jgi:hypothetical protein
VAIRITTCQLAALTETGPTAVEQETFAISQVVPSRQFIKNLQGQLCYLEHVFGLLLQSPDHRKEFV